MAEENFKTGGGKNQRILTGAGENVWGLKELGNNGILEGRGNDSTLSRLFHEASGRGSVSDKNFGNREGGSKRSSAKGFRDLVEKMQ